MVVSRRAVMILLGGALHPAFARAGAASPFVLAPMPQDRIAVTGPGLTGSGGTGSGGTGLGGTESGGGVVSLPGRRARLISVLRLNDGPIAVVAFAADPRPGERLDMAAILGGSDLRVLALEPLSWRDRDGTTLSSRITATGDLTRLRIEREAARPPRRESWTDWLRWTAGQLTDQPVRPPRVGTWQADLSVGRARLAARCGERFRAVTETDLALVTLPG